MTCGCDKCAGSNPSQALQITKCEPPVLFHKVQYPASLGNDTEVPPESLDYRNVLLTYEANNHSYLYSSDGIPTLISMGELDVEEITAQIAALGGQLAEETANRENGDAELSNQLATLQNDLGQAVSELQADVANEALERSEADQNLQNQISDLNESVETQLDSLDAAITALEDATVQKDTAVSADVSTVTITKTTGELTGEGVETRLPLPVASSESAGVMNTATFNAVQENSENIDSILGGAVVIEDLPAEPTDEQLTVAWKEATGKTELINRASIYDETNKRVWYYYENASAWKAIDATPSFSVSVATNEAAGIVKGSTEDGQVAVEADGSMSLNGYDGMQHDIDNLTQLVAGIEVPNVPTWVVGTSSLTGGSLTFKPSSTKPSQMALYYSQYSNRKNVIPSAYALVLPNATTDVSGVMSATDKSKLDSLLEIKSLNDSLELDENGQLSVVGGGGSDVNLLSEYSASPAESDVYGAGYVNSLATITPVSGSTNTFLLTLGSALGSFPRLQILTNAQALGSNSMAIGYGAKAIAADTIVLGNRASASHQKSVALGERSATSRINEVSIGSGTINLPSTRFLANVTAGELDTDAVNLKQMQDYVAEQIGDVATVLETLTTGAGV